MQSQNSEVSVEFSMDIPQDAVSCEELDLIQAHFAGLIRQLMMEADLGGDNHPGRWCGVEGGVAAADFAPPSSPSWWGFRMADRSLKKRSAPCQEPELLTNRFVYI